MGSVAVNFFFDAIFVRTAGAAGIWNLAMLPSSTLAPFTAEAAGLLPVTAWNASCIPKSGDAEACWPAIASAR